jgi:NADH:ubiquinone oxidoreductase subunit 6 (subunit J)
LITSTPVVIAIYGAGALLLISGLGVVLLRSLDQVAMAFIGCLLMVAVLAWVLDAPAVAALQLAIGILAAGGLLVVPGFRPSPTPPQGGGDHSAGEFSGQLIPGAIAAVAILALMAVALLRATWRTFVPGTGTTWGEYLVGLVVAALVVLVGAVGILSLPRARERPTGPIEAPASRRKRDRR